MHYSVTLLTDEQLTVNSVTKIFSIDDDEYIDHHQWKKLFRKHFRSISKNNK